MPYAEEIGQRASNSLSQWLRVDNMFHLRQELLLSDEDVRVTWSTPLLFPYVLFRETKYKSRFILIKIH